MSPLTMVKYSLLKSSKTSKGCMSISVSWIILFLFHVCIFFRTMIREVAIMSQRTNAEQEPMSIMFRHDLLYSSIMELPQQCEDIGILVTALRGLKTASRFVLNWPCRPQLPLTFFWCYNRRISLFSNHCYSYSDVLLFLGLDLELINVFSQYFLSTFKIKSTFFFGFPIYNTCSISISRMPSINICTMRRSSKSLGRILLQ